MISLALINEFIGMPPNASEHGYQIDHIIEFCHWFMGALFVGWSVFFIYVLIRFRKSRHPVADHEGVKSGISTHLEFAVVLIEAVLLIGFAVPLWAKRVNEFPDDKDAILVHAIGQQFNWNFHLPGPDGQFRPARHRIWSAIRIRSGSTRTIRRRRMTLLSLANCTCRSNRPVIIELSSKDVIHNFALPNMRIAQDAIPGQVIPMWFQADQDRHLRSGLRSALRSRSLRHEGDPRGGYARGLSGVVEGTRGTFRDAERAAARRAHPEGEANPGDRRRLPEHRSLPNRRRASLPAESAAGDAPNKVSACCAPIDFGMLRAMLPASTNRWLHRFAWFTAVATLFLICSGGMVTSKGVGLAVPDWPTTFGYNMFFFPVSQWVGGIFFEHTHRLIASTVGFLTIILAVWLWRAESRRWLRNLGLVALGAVVLQGVLGWLARDVAEG